MMALFCFQVQREKAEVAILEANMEAVFADANKEDAAANESHTAIQTEKIAPDTGIGGLNNVHKLCEYP